MPVIISDFFVSNNKKIHCPQSIELENYENSFTIHFILANYRDPRSIKYEYILDGFDQEWVNAGSRRDAIYTNIPPGKYNFRVRARLKDGKVSKDTNFSIFIHKPGYFSNIAIIIWSCKTKNI